MPKKNKGKDKTPKEKPVAKDPKKPKVHKDLEGFQITINEFGEIVSNMNLDKLNEFLDENLDDKKLKKGESSKDSE